jgi:hypothetical protein
MNKLFKQDILTVDIHVKGETDDYEVKISFGGFLEILKDQLDKLSARLDNVVTALKNSPTTAEDGGAAYKSGIGTIIDTYTETHPKEDFSKIENTKIKHGDGSSS